MKHEMVDGVMVATPFTAEEIAAQNAAISEEAFTGGKARAIEANLKRREDTIFGSVIVLATGHRIDTGQWTQQMLKELRDQARAGHALPGGDYWRTEDDQMVALTQADLEEYGSEIMQLIQSAYALYWDTKAAIEAAVSVADLPVI